MVLGLSSVLWRYLYPMFLYPVVSMITSVDDSNDDLLYKNYSRNEAQKGESDKNKVHVVLPCSPKESGWLCCFVLWCCFVGKQFIPQSHHRGPEGLDGLGRPPDKLLMKGPRREQVRYVQSSFLWKDPEGSKRERRFKRARDCNLDTLWI